MKLPHRRQFLHLAAGAPGHLAHREGASLPNTAYHNDRSVRCGRPLDVFARIIAEGMRPSLGQPVIVENVAGADGSIGVGRAARAKPDGYTINLGILSTHVLNGAFYSLPYDLLNDFTPIAGLEKTALIIVGTKTLPAKDLAELIAWIKSNPNKASAPGSKRSSILDSLRSSFTRNCEKDQYGHSAGYRHGPNCLSHPGLLHPARTSTL